jgi:hypothetical protein
MLAVLEVLEGLHSRVCPGSWRYFSGGDAADGEALGIDPVRHFDCAKGVNENSSRDTSCFFSKV